MSSNHFEYAGFVSPLLFGYPYLVILLAVIFFFMSPFEWVRGCVFIEGFLPPCYSLVDSDIVMNGVTLLCSSMLEKIVDAIVRDWIREGSYITAMYVILF